MPLTSLTYRTTFSIKWSIPQYATILQREKSISALFLENDLISPGPFQWDGSKDEKKKKNHNYIWCSKMMKIDNSGWNLDLELSAGLVLIHKRFSTKHCANQRRVREE